MPVQSRPQPVNYLVEHPWALVETRTALEKARVWIAAVIPGHGIPWAEGHARRIIRDTVHPHVLNTALARFPGAETANELWGALVVERVAYTLYRVDDMNVTRNGERAFINDARQCLAAVQALRTGLNGVPASETELVDKEFRKVFVKKVEEALGECAPEFEAFKTFTAEGAIDEFERLYTHFFPGC